MVDDKRWAAYFAQVAEDLLADPGEVTFARVVHRAVDVVSAADHCGITLRQRGGRSETVAATDDLVSEVDAAQYSLGEGPCLEAAFESGSCLADDLRSDGRWPRWSRAATRRGIHSVLAIRLHAENRTLGALNLYAERSGAFDPDTVDTALIFASHAAEALSKARLVSNLEAALESRHVIGMAQGVLAVRYDVSYESAFTVLQRYSNDHNVKLREVARMVLETRALPSARLGRVDADLGDLDPA
ncbi:GAF and ANTAR domain-containing protein [Nocardioides sp. W7]|uniref:GAF and ANTAR domain-containing protein n=1 Tax=Nocardioides sp. W7 TaxID=2931390 RepID=UPI001FD366F2|nr:GAF and ANTAR domain-containing protein [Nocardioides sp. W7]